MLKTILFAKKDGNVFYSICPKRKEVISTDDIIDLHASLEAAEDVLQFVVECQAS